MNINENQIIGELVAKDYRTASVFKKFGIDFCCQGNRTIHEACDKKSLDSTLVVNELDATINSKTDVTTDFQSWPLDLLADYIEKKHHRYVTTKIREIKPYLEKISRVHGDNHPELLKIKDHFNETAAGLAMHMKKEELILFPYIRKLADAQYGSSEIRTPHFGSVRNPIKMMMDEHTTEGDRFREIAALPAIILHRRMRVILTAWVMHYSKNLSRTCICIFIWRIIFYFQKQ